MVPEALAGGPGRRGARIPPHSRHATRRTPGLEAALVDNSAMTITALDPADSRQSVIAVAGPAALLVSKLHKLGERQHDPGRLIDKDAHDIYRLLIATESAEVGGRLGELSSDQLAGPATITAVSHLRELFARAEALGSMMAGRAEQIVGDPAVVSAAATALAGDVLAVIDAHR